MKLVLSDELYSGIHTSHLFVVCQWAYANEKPSFMKGVHRDPTCFFVEWLVLAVFNSLIVCSV